MALLVSLRRLSLLLGAVHMLHLKLLGKYKVGAGHYFSAFFEPAFKSVEVGCV